MERKVFDSLDHDALILACIEQAIQQVRGKNPAVKFQVYEKLTPGQRALFLFRVLYGHSNSIAEFCMIVSSYFDSWSEFKNGIQYFGDNPMFQVYEEIERVYTAMEQKSGREEFLSLISESPQLFETLGRLYKTYQEIIPATIQRIGLYIRNNPGEFVKIID